MVCSAGLLTIPVVTGKRPGTVFALSRTGEGCTAPASTPRLRAATSLFEAHSAFRNFNWRSGAYPLTTYDCRSEGCRGRGGYCKALPETRQAVGASHGQARVLAAYRVARLRCGVTISCSSVGLATFLRGDLTCGSATLRLFRGT